MTCSHDSVLYIGIGIESVWIRICVYRSPLKQNLPLAWSLKNECVAFVSIAFHFVLLAERHPQLRRWIISLFADTAYLVLASTYVYLRPETCIESYAEPLRTRYTLSPPHRTVHPITKTVWKHEDLILPKFCLFHTAYFDAIMNAKLVSPIVVFKLSPCCRYGIFSYGYFLGVWILKNRHFGTLCRFHLHRWKTEPTVCSEMSSF
jgi:hypothetical protein